MQGTFTHTFQCLPSAHQCFLSHLALVTTLCMQHAMSRLLRPVRKSQDSDACALLGADALEQQRLLLTGQARVQQRGVPFRGLPRLQDTPGELGHQPVAARLAARSALQRIACQLLNLP